MNAKSGDLDAGAYGRIGQILRGKYCLERVLGIGGMSVVYAATHRNRARFAIKILSDELSARPDIRMRFLREGYAANSVGHPAVVRVVDDDTTEDGAAFLVVELLEGIGVEALWERYERRMPVPAALAIAERVLDGLAAAHSSGVVHRDVKPANLFITTDGTVKILDFGIARVRDAAQSMTEARTGDGMLLGTPAFMSPEQSAGRADAIDARADIWSVGATLFTLLAGRYVHEADDIAELLVRAASFRAPSLREVLPRARPQLVELVDCALAFEKHARWPDAASMRHAVRRLYRQVIGQRLAPAGLLQALVTEPSGPLSADEPRSEDTLRDQLPAGAVPPSGRVRTEPAVQIGASPWTLPMTDRPPAQGSSGSSTTAPPVATDPFAPLVPTSPPPRLRRSWRIAGAAVVPAAVGGVLLAAFRLGGDGGAHVEASTRGAAAAAVPLVSEPPSEALIATEPADLSHKASSDVAPSQAPPAASSTSPSTTASAVPSSP